jgi:hypothetical protein
MNSSKTTPKDFFVQFGATVALYVAAGALINLALSIIDYLNPDALAGYFSPSSIAWPISMLVVLVPDPLCLGMAGKSRRRSYS